MIVTCVHKMNFWLLWADQAESLGRHWITRTTHLFQIMLSIVAATCYSWSTLIYNLLCSYSVSGGLGKIFLCVCVCINRKKNQVKVKMREYEETVVQALRCLSIAAEPTENFHLLQSIPAGRVDDLSWPPSGSNQHCCMFIRAGKDSAAVHHQSADSVFVWTVYSIVVWVIRTVSHSCTNYFNIILMIISLVLVY